MRRGKYLYSFEGHKPAPLLPVSVCFISFHSLEGHKQAPLLPVSVSHSQLPGEHPDGRPHRRASFCFRFLEFRARLLTVAPAEAPSPPSLVVGSSPSSRRTGHSQGHVAITKGSVEGIFEGGVWILCGTGFFGHFPELPFFVFREGQLEVLNDLDGCHELFGRERDTEWSLH